MECIWCEGGDDLYKIARKICSFPTGTLYLHNDQTHPGRCIFAYCDHIQKITQLSRIQYLELMGDIYTVIQVLTDVFQPDKVNILVLGDTAPHMHIHICPKYKNGKEWGIPFVVNEALPCLKTDADMQGIIRRIREKI